MSLAGIERARFFWTCSECEGDPCRVQTPMNVLGALMAPVRPEHCICDGSKCAWKLDGTAVEE